jgi:hypothetical protein
MTDSPPSIDVRQVYDQFDSPITAFDCGMKCAPHNPSGKPFCCDICQAIPAVYYQEWVYLRQNTDLWHVWRGDECVEKPEDPAGLRAETSDTMLLLACQGPANCHRAYRALSCRQFPFTPYLSAGLRFLGLVYEWEFESTCWVVSHLDEVSAKYRQEFIQAYDWLFDLWPEELNSYIRHSEDLRAHYIAKKRRILILHRNGGNFLLSPASERLQRVTSAQLPRFGPYKG